MTLKLKEIKTSFNYRDQNSLIPVVCDVPELIFYTTCYTIKLPKNQSPVLINP